MAGQQRIRVKHAQKDRGLDFYQTHPIAVRALLAHERLPHGLWEPHCGLGGIAEVLFDAGHAVYCSDITNRGYPQQSSTGDFLKSTRCPQGVDGIIMNPPFAWAAQHVRHALSICPYVVALLRLSFLEAGNVKTESGRARLWCLDRGHLARVHVFRERLPFMHRHGWEGKKSTSNVPYAWFVFDGDHNGPTEVRRISWKENEQVQNAGVPGEARRLRAGQCEKEQGVDLRAPQALEGKQSREVSADTA
jgi:hypothetical protein